MMSLGLKALLGGCERCSTIYTNDTKLASKSSSHYTLSLMLLPAYLSIPVPCIVQGWSPAVKPVLRGFSFRLLSLFGTSLHIAPASALSEPLASHFCRTSCCSSPVLSLLLTQRLCVPQSATDRIAHVWLLSPTPAHYQYSRRSALQVYQKRQTSWTFKSTDSLKRKPRCEE